MISDNHLNPPEPCSACEKYYAYQDGLCWECWTEAQEDRAIAKYEEKRDREESWWESQ
jgi:predicted amidophosphoribosyltransferase